MTVDALLDRESAADAVPYHSTAVPESITRKGGTTTISLVEHRRQLAEILAFVSEGSTVGLRLAALARLLYKVLNEAMTPEGTAFAEELYLVADILETMAARLDSFETQACARRDHFEAGAAL